MSGDVALAIDGEAKEVLLRTKSEGHYDEGGRWVPGGNVDNPIQAAVQPLTLLSSGGGLEDLPEGIRAEARKRLWTRSLVKENDIVVERGISYRVMIVFDWFDAGGYYEAILGKTA